MIIFRKLIGLTVNSEYISVIPKVKCTASAVANKNYHLHAKQLNKCQVSLLKTHKTTIALLKC